MGRLFREGVVVDVLPGQVFPTTTDESGVEKSNDALVTTGHLVSSKNSGFPSGLLGLDKTRAHSMGFESYYGRARSV